MVESDCPLLQIKVNGAIPELAETARLPDKSPKQFSFILFLIIMAGPFVSETATDKAVLQPNESDTVTVYTPDFKAVTEFKVLLPAFAVH